MCGNKQRVDTFKEAVEYCDKYECDGIYDENCDGRTIYICGELRKPKGHTLAQNGCTYRKKGIDKNGMGLQKVAYIFYNLFGYDFTCNLFIFSFPSGKYREC